MECRRARNQAEKRRRYYRLTGRPGLVSARPTQRLVEGIVAQGWAYPAIERMLGWHSSKGMAIHNLMTRAKVERRTAARVAALAEKIGDRWAPADNRGASISRAKALSRAARNGWLPLAWGTDEEIAELPAVRELLQAEERRELVAEVERLNRVEKVSLTRLADRYGVTDRTVSRWIAEAREDAATAPQVDGEALTA